MRDVLCGEVRAYLDSARSGHPDAPDPDVWKALESHGAVSGSPGAPQLTAIGEHVLSELNVIGYRADAQSLTAVSEGMGRLLTELDSVAKTAEYFLAELGPVAPVDALPLLRPVAIGLANRRETPEQLAEEFRNVWGSVEVMGGDPRDRLLAAELLNAAEARIDRIYAPIMNTVQRIRESQGERGSAVTAGTLLLLTAPADGRPRLDAFHRLRSAIPNDEAAAMLTGVNADTGIVLSLAEGFRQGLGATSSSDATLAASYLATVRADPAQDIARTREIGAALAARFPQPLTPAAMLAVRTSLAAHEIAHWVAKATEIARVRKLAPTESELSALGLGLVCGLPASAFDFAAGAVADAGSPESRVRLLASTVALHAWVYRPLIAAGSSPAPGAVSAN
ncbi:MAG TPA: hypothetical protein VFF67_04480 [Thermoplasmata archaeon]|nr:hypothetical protein [Thermoplasmata archaeon]